MRKMAIFLPKKPYTPSNLHRLFLTYFVENADAVPADRPLQNFTWTRKSS